MTTIYGTVGYTFLKSNNTYILIFSDVHSKLKYCDKFIQISEWLEKNMDNVNILLEEVSRDDFKLNELWDSSDHTIKLKNLFLNNQKKIFDIDIRPYLIPYSWELFNSYTDLENMTLKNYLEILNKFLYLKLDKINNKLLNIYNTTFLKNHKLKKHLHKIRVDFDIFLIKNMNYMNMFVKDIYKKNEDILFDLNLLLDSCMEWYSIAKIYDLQLSNNKNFIIHTGLFHAERIVNDLQKIHDYKIISQHGVTNMINVKKLEPDNINYTGCIFIPDLITETITENNIN